MSYDLNHPGDVQTILSLAQEQLRDHGLAKHEYVDEDGCLCAYGAVNVVVDYVPPGGEPALYENYPADRDAWITPSDFVGDETLLQRALMNAAFPRAQASGLVNDSLPVSPSVVSIYSDMETTTVDDVIAMFEDAKDWVRG